MKGISLWQPWASLVGRGKNKPDDAQILEAEACARGMELYL